jgi:hypothetical protein
MGDIDQQGQLYLGREYDLSAGAITDTDVMLKARHLTTHAVILGMTGSGKTGLGMILLEEALLQGVPVLAIDPKGDLTNLLLTFPDLAPEDFAPWVDAERARREGRSVDQVAAETAQTWRQGLAQWDIGPDRIARLRDTIDMALYTPGSDVATPIDVLHRFRAPDLDWESHGERIRDRIESLVTALLGLAGRDADPLQSSEHVFLSHLVEHTWKAGQDLDLPTLIRAIQEPPIQQIGVFDLESFLPRKDRVALARALNNIFAAPGFATWRAGVPLEVEDFLYTANDRPRASVFYLPHLNDAERSFFITLLLGAVREWMLAQPGTSDLRALLYLDEVFGFFPPHPHNPPTKQPLMSLIKQGRAAGLGVVLSTQNPADLDYKGLTNAGVWSVGTLRTDRDKERVLEGIEGAAAAAGGMLQGTDLDQALGTLKPRVFLLHNVRDDAPCFFHTRWAMSFLPGPLTRTQVRQLAPGAGPVEAPDPVPPTRTEAAPAPAAAPATAAAAPPPSLEPDLASGPPTLAASVSQAFLPATVASDWALRQHEERTGRQVLLQSKQLVYVPHLLGVATVFMVDDRKGVNHEEKVARLLDPSPPPARVDWDEGAVDLTAGDLSNEPVGEGGYLEVPRHLANGNHHKSWNRAFSDYLYRTIRVTIWHNPELEVYGEVGESRRDFRVRCEAAARELREEELEEERERFQKQVDRVEDKLRREKRELDEDEIDLTARKREEMLSGAESVLNLISGRRSSAMLSSASRRRRMTQKAKADVEESLDVIEDLEQELRDLAEAWEELEEKITDRWAETLEEVEEVQIAPRRRDVVVDFCGLAWVPMWEIETDRGQRLMLPANDMLAEEGS